MADQYFSEMNPEQQEQAINAYFDALTTDSRFRSPAFIPDRETYLALAADPGKVRRGTPKIFRLKNSILRKAPYRSKKDYTVSEQDWAILKKLQELDIAVKEQKDFLQYGKVEASEYYQAQLAEQIETNRQVFNYMAGNDTPSSFTLLSDLMIQQMETKLQSRITENQPDAAPFSEFEIETIKLLYMDTDYKTGDLIYSEKLLTPLEQKGETSYSRDLASIGKKLGRPLKSTINNIPEQNIVWDTFAAIHNVVNFDVNMEVAEEKYSVLIVELGEELDILTATALLMQENELRAALTPEAPVVEAEPEIESVPEEALEETPEEAPVEQPVTEAPEAEQSEEEQPEEELEEFVIQEKVAQLSSDTSFVGRSRFGWKQPLSAAASVLIGFAALYSGYLAGKKDVVNTQASVKQNITLTTDSVSAFTAAADSVDIPAPLESAPVLAAAKTPVHHASVARDDVFQDDEIQDDVLQGDEILGQTTDLQASLHAQEESSQAETPAQEPARAPIEELPKVAMQLPAMAPIKLLSLPVNPAADLKVVLRPAIRESENSKFEKMLAKAGINDLTDEEKQVPAGTSATEYFELLFTPAMEEEASSADTLLSVTAAPVAVAKDTGNIVVVVKQKPTPPVSKPVAASVDTLPARSSVKQEKPVVKNVSWHEAEKSYQSKQASKDAEKVQKIIQQQKALKAEQDSIQKTRSMNSREMQKFYEKDSKLEHKKAELMGPAIIGENTTSIITPQMRPQIQQAAEVPAHIAMFKSNMSSTGASGQTFNYVLKA